MAIDTELALLRNRRTKIVATLGPASNSPEMVAALVDAGVNVFRLNMSHGDHDAHRQTFAHIRDVREHAGRAIAVLADLAGPKIRVGRFEGGGIDLVEGERVTVTTREVTGSPGVIPSQYEAFARDVSDGDRVLLADGLMELRVLGVDGPDVECVVVHGGALTDRKGINLPEVALSTPCLTDKDRDDARFALELGVDFLGLSFVRRGSDVDELQALIRESGGSARVIAKIERPEALLDSEAILSATDGIMVARGDLGVELPPEQVPIAQHELVDHARRRNKPVIVATQMLESMIENARPTRAEVSDVSNTVMSGADAIMLSGETASGAHPVAAVEMMSRIAKQAEAYAWKHGAFGAMGEEHEQVPPIPFGDAVARSTAQLSRDLRVRAIVAASHSGMSAQTMSAARPAAPVICVSTSEETYRRMALQWGVIPYLADEAEVGDVIALARDLARRLELAKAGEFILLVRWFSSDPAANTPSITLLTI